jgi:hypothetical protein
MSGLPPFANELPTFRIGSFVPEADMAMGLFDHLVGASKNARRDDRILITKFVPDRRFAGESPRLVASIFCPLPDRQLHKYQPAGPRDARVNHHNLLIVDVTRHADRPCRRCRAGLLHLGKR